MDLLRSDRDRARLKLIAELVNPATAGRRLTQARAAELLGLGERQARRLAATSREEGDAGLVHKSRGRPSNRRFTDEFRAQVMAVVREQYHDFGPTLAAEKLQERGGEQAVLIALINDATSRVFMRFFASDTTEANMAILRDYIATCGRPMAFYGDNASHLHRHPPPSYAEVYTLAWTAAQAHGAGSYESPGGTGGSLVEGP